MSDTLCKLDACTSYRGGETVHAYDANAKIVAHEDRSICGCVVSHLHEPFNPDSSYACKKCVAILRKGVPQPISEKIMDIGGISVCGGCTHLLEGACSVCVNKAVAAAEERGRRRGVEEAAKRADQWYVHESHEPHSPGDSIRALLTKE